MSAELIVAAMIIVALAGALARVLLKLRRLAAPMQFSGGLARAGWGNVPQSWLPALTAITLSAHDMFWETDEAHAYARFFKRDNGFDLSDLTGKRPWDLPSVGVSAAQWETLKASMEAHEPFDNFVIGRVDPAGRQRFGSLSGSPAFDDKSGFIGYRGAIRDVTISRHAQLQLQIQGEITRILADSQRLSEAMPELIEAVCRPLEWIYGARWMRDPREDTFVRGESWALSGAQPLVDVTRGMRIPVGGTDLLSRAWAGGGLEWVADLRIEPEGARRNAALAAGLGAAFALPVKVQGDIVCMLEFFGPQVQQRDDFIDGVVESLNHQIALFWLRREAEARLTYAATHDGLTGLRNRLAFQAELDKAVARAERNSWRAAVLFIDLDGFKRINDLFGHGAGDIVLAESARRFKSVLRASDTIARLGGDEFVVLLEQAGDDGAIADVARKMVRTLDAPFAGIDATARVGASVGVAIYPVDARDSTLLLGCADAAMYKAKAAANSSVAFYRPPANQAPSLDRAPPDPTAIEPEAPSEPG